MVNNNLQWLQNTYVDGAGPYESAPRGMLEGLFDNPWNDQSSRDPYGTASVWMNDYVAAALGTLSARGFANAESILAWQANVLAGRYISSDLGMSSLNGAIYQLPNTKSNNPLATRGPTKPSEGYTFRTWTEVQAAIEAKGQNATQFSNWVWPGDIATKSMNGISAMMSYADNVDAYQAYGFLASGTYANRHAAIFSQQPRNSIQPVLSDGTLLVLTRQRMGGTGADQMTGSGQVSYCTETKATTSSPAARGSTCFTAVLEMISYLEMKATTICSETTAMINYSEAKVTTSCEAI